MSMCAGFILRGGGNCFNLFVFALVCARVCMSDEVLVNNFMQIPTSPYIDNFTQNKISTLP